MLTFFRKIVCIASLVDVAQVPDEGQNFVIPEDHMDPSPFGLRFALEANDQVKNSLVAGAAVHEVSAHHQMILTSRP